MTRAAYLLRIAFSCVCAVFFFDREVDAAEVRVQLVEASVLRTEPSESARAVAEVASGSVLRAIGDDGSGWVAVAPPDSMECWIYSALVRDGAVAAHSVYVRTGPGVENPPIGSVNRGQQLSIRGEKSGWYRIDPPKQFLLYVRRDKLSDPARKTAAAITRPKAPASTAHGWEDAEEPIGAPVPVGGEARLSPRNVTRQSPVAMTPVAATRGYAEGTSSSSYGSGAIVAPPRYASASGAGTAQLSSGERVEISGTLRPSGALVWRRPSRFRLVSLDRQGRARTLCYLIGDEARLYADMGRQVRVSGRVIDLFGVRYDAVVVEQMSTF